MKAFVREVNSVIQSREGFFLFDVVVLFTDPVHPPAYMSVECSDVSTTLRTSFKVALEQKILDERGLVIDGLIFPNMIVY